jgi:class 3 adenylate cyclase
VSDTTTTPTDPAVPSGERRQVTALFADMIGFTAISERLGEEGTFALIQPIYDLMARAVREQSGSVKDFTGDGIMALFGVPDALEDGPLRACRAGLAIQERLAAAVPAIEAKHGVRPQMRIGVNSGMAVVTRIRGGSGPATALGDTVNLASRLQTLAEPGTVYLSEATQRLVQGLVETTFAGEHAIKGKAERQKVFRLEAIRHGATRFEAAVGRGLSVFVGRERELEVLERALADAGRELRVIDVVADPGMGKSRLLHEFRRRMGEGKVFVLSGSSSPDGRQTPFLPFIEVVRGSFQVKAGEAEAEIASKLDLGLNMLGLQSPENLGLLLNLLGLKPPEGSLSGLDGVLIGLRTRDLLLRLLEARCCLSQTVLLLEDLHWIDSVSQEVLGKIVEGEAKQHLLVLYTRRPEYEPPWHSSSGISTLRLEPLPAGEIKRLIQTRLGVDALPEALARQVTEKAEGNALFAEEILSFLAERGMLRVAGGKLEFDPAGVARALPPSLQSLLSARVDRLAPKDRGLLQAAAVIGRRFDPELLASVADEAGEIDTRLSAMRAFDLIYPEAKSTDYSFKHALVRDALYQSLLTQPRAALHLKIAEEIERRSGNQLSEVVESLAYHYGRTDRHDKAFNYLAMAGAKSLGVYSLDETDQYLTAAIALVDKSADCASDQQLVDLLVNYALLSNISLNSKLTTEVVERFASRLDRLGDNHKRVLLQHHYVYALMLLARYREAKEAQEPLSGMATRLGDSVSTAYSLSSALYVSVIVAPYPIKAFEALSRSATIAASDINDGYLQVFLRIVFAWDELHRGRMTEALRMAEELAIVGQRIGDPRAVGSAMSVHAWIALMSDNYAEALNFSESGMSSARTIYDFESNRMARCISLTFLRRPEAFSLLQDLLDQFARSDWYYYRTPAEGAWGVALVLHGEFGRGLHWLEQAIVRRDKEGYHSMADWYRLFLCEIYLEIISGAEKPPLSVLARNIVTILKVVFTARRRVLALLGNIRKNPQFDPNGHYIGRCEMIIGLLYKTKKKRGLAIEHLTEAKRIASQFGPTPMLAKIEAALAELA